MKWNYVLTIIYVCLMSLLIMIYCSAPSPKLSKPLTQEQQEERDRLEQEWEDARIAKVEAYQTLARSEEVLKIHRILIELDVPTKSYYDNKLYNMERELERIKNLLQSHLSDHIRHNY